MIPPCCALGEKGLASVDSIRTLGVPRNSKRDNRSNTLRNGVRKTSPRDPVEPERNVGGEQLLPTKLSKSTAKYLEKLRLDLEAAKILATENSLKNQKRYVDRYNLKSRSKTFTEGDPVIILMPESTNKLLKRWIGPAKIRRKLSENSYDVESDDGSIRRLHANHLRRYNERVLAVFDTDQAFGNVENVPLKRDEYPKNVDEAFQELNLEYLNSAQRDDVLRILHQHREVFSDRPDLCDPRIAEHVIRLNVEEKDWPK